MKRFLPLFAMLTSSLIAVESITLFNGKDLAGWKVDVPKHDGNTEAKPTFFVRNGVMVTSGTPLGHIYTEKAYENYTLTVEYRFSKEPGNSGLMLHSTTPRFLGEIFPQSIEVQMESGNAGLFIAIGHDLVGTDGKSKPELKDQKKSRAIKKLVSGAEKPPGEWNQMVVHAQGDTIVVVINGTLVNVASDSTATKGKIAFQSEGCEVEFRKVELLLISR